MKNWTIRKLGGITKEDAKAHREAYDRLVTQMATAGKVNIIAGDYIHLDNALFDGWLLIAPDASNISMHSCVFHGERKEEA